MRVTFDKKTPVLVQAADEPRMVEEERELGPQGEELREFDPDQPRDKNGSFSMGTVAKFEHEDGRVSIVTKFNDKFHVNVLKNGQPYLPSAMYSDKEEAVSKAEGLLKREDARRVPEGWHVYDVSGKEQRWF